MTDEPKISDLIPVAEPKRGLADLSEALEWEELEDVLDGAELNARLPRKRREQQRTKG